MGATNFENDPEKQRINDDTAERIDAELRPLMAAMQESPDGSTIASMLTVGRLRTIEEVLPSLKVLILGGHAGAGPRRRILPGRAARRPRPAGSRPRRARTLGRRRPRGPALGGTDRNADPPGRHGRRARRAHHPGRCRRRRRRGECLPRRDGSSTTRIGSTSARAFKANAAFGYGPHFCAGHAFARGQERIALQVLVDAAARAWRSILGTRWRSGAGSSAPRRHCTSRGSRRRAGRLTV